MYAYLALYACGVLATAYAAGLLGRPLSEVDKPAYFLVTCLLWPLSWLVVGLVAVLSYVSALGYRSRP